MTKSRKADRVEHTDTSCFTYEVRMFVQVLAQNKDEADEKLERDGGYVTQREVFFVDKTSIHSGDNPEASE